MPLHSKPPSKVPHFHSHAYCSSHSVVRPCRAYLQYRFLYQSPPFTERRQLASALTKRGVTFGTTICDDFLS